MTTPQKKLIRRVAFAVAVIGVMIPVTVSPNQGLDANDACADGSCCRELMSVCNNDGSSTTHYYNSTGPCTAKDLQ